MAFAVNVIWIKKKKVLKLSNYIKKKKNVRKEKKRRFLNISFGDFPCTHTTTTVGRLEYFSRNLTNYNILVEKR